MRNHTDYDELPSFYAL